MNDEIEREIMFHPEATVEIRSASDNNEEQISDIRYFIDNGFDIIIAAPNEADALTPVITEAYDRGIPVLIFDRNVHGDSYTAFQGADNAGIGKMAARYTSDLFPAGATVIELEGLPGSTPAEERGKGFREVADSLGHRLRILASEPANWSYDEASKVADSLLNLYPDVDVIYAHNDRMAIGASDVARRRGLDPVVIGIDAAPSIGLKAVKEGKIDATFLYPTEGQQLVRTAMAILQGGEYQKQLLIPASPAVNQSNVDLLLRQDQALAEETGHMKLLKAEMDDYWSEHTSQTTVLYTSIAILILLCIVLFLVLRAFWQHRAHRAQLMAKNKLLEEQRDTEKDLNRQLDLATQSKLTFFTNVSHDLRTPLTLIAEPVDQMVGAPNLTEQQQALIKIADKNVKILNRLINQILDFQKFENDRLPLNLEEVAPALYGKEWGEAFLPLARKRYIDFKVDIDIPDSFTMAIDIEKMERVVFNLLANAFKFTPIKGKIIFSMKRSDENLIMTVEDTGRGISETNLKNIFSRFYQVETVRPEGSGIGLSLAKAFVELHDGSITAESEEGKGTTFTVKLPISHVEGVASADSLMQSAESAREAANLIKDIPIYASGPDDENIEANDKPLLLIIDDNADVRQLVSELLKDDFRILMAPEGKEGFRKAVKYVPDVIVCDVMMPGTDGMETCAAIKKEISTSHIPVLMLTACALDEQRVEGYENGADGYMSKPFKSEVLKARLASLIANRRRIRDLYASPVTSVKKSVHEGEKAAKPADREKEFYNRLTSLINEEMGNVDLNVDTLAEKMGMGRSQFYRKIKALTNLSPVELLRDMRLKKARDLLLTTERTISEIAYTVGFSTPAYFTKCYREVYSETPSAVRENIR